jgi:hypothetical protein
VARDRHTWTSRVRQILEAIQHHGRPRP